MNGLLIPIVSVGGMALALGAILGVAERFLHVEQDETVGLVHDALPGANCGACGYAGCLAFAQEVAGGHAPTDGCPVGGEATAHKVARIMGMDATAFIRETAFVRCKGIKGVSKDQYDYYGMTNCVAVEQLPGNGPKVCHYGCLGYGTCADVCAFDAIDMIDGIAVINRDKCTACAKCEKVCPRNLIEIVPHSNNIRVSCISQDMGALVRKACAVGCTGCGICMKTCQYDAIIIENRVAKVDYEKCTQCEDCIAKCPTSSIDNILKEAHAKKSIETEKETTAV